MAGRPRMYGDAAEKNRAYRARQEKQSVKMRRDDLERFEEHLDRLHAAVFAAADAGDVLACSLDTITSLDLLATLAAHFEGCAVSPEEENR